MKKLNNFGDLSVEYSDIETSDIIVIPVCYDKTSTWIKGADNGPLAIIEASVNMELYDIETDFEVYRLGIYTEKPLRLNIPPEKMTARIRHLVKTRISENKFVVCLGGEHSISIGAIQAHSEMFDNLSILQLDAHSDLRDEYNGSKFNHACVMARAAECAKIVQAGIRSMDITEKSHPAASSIFYCEKILNEKNFEWIDRIIKKLTDNVYITIDLDVFDPSIMAATGTPEPGGLLWYDVLKLLKQVAAKKNIAGFDIVELCPNPINKHCDFLAAKLTYKLLSYIFHKKKINKRGY